ncbi:molybdate ABC transporter substrate-binding protein [Poritiphilus flavus]|uniref:molybdate ABC transporter substrate-binding protein n=1 Tax=Poritiphilus flavus TaxID=2697053 RepID=UPI00293BC731|nr:molybdate ABC transporter substrate-binding protein [Poritiphilus flavus]
MSTRDLLLKWIPYALVLLLSACGTKRDSSTLTIAAAANTQFAMEEIAALYSEKTGTQHVLVFSSSGKLTAQIMEGAPYDVFVSADMKYPTELFNSGLTQGSPRVYAYGKLVLWSIQESVHPSLAILKDSTVEHIALANPKTAPYGRAADEVLKFYDLYPTTSAKLVFGESISQTNQFITSGAAEIGFTAMSVVLSPKMKGKGSWQALDENSYKPIGQGVVALQSKGETTEGANEFITFLFSKEARGILEKYGYTFDE